ncbi:MAG: hypothetical protein HRT58_14680 [Crocinitomicaceae bacterium]|nr:hypothetical protein [Flavobacteriales bacterium]NQZ36913.1 hypothetical protein [Crocinitomicaceae bacterium]
MQTTIEEVNPGITEWARIINSENIPKKKEKIINYLNQGFCFEVTREDYDFWTNKGSNEPQEPDFIHAYVGIFDCKMKFVLIDSVTDNILFEGPKKIRVKDFTYGISLVPDTPSGYNSGFDPKDVNIPMQRSFLWNLFCKDWLASTINAKQSIFQVINIPFEDYKNVFSDPNNNNSINFFGLKKEIGSDNYMIELLIANQPAEFQLPTVAYNITRPVPPFGGGIALGEFSLLPQ